MRYHALAADYDGTLAHHGQVDEATWASLEKLRETGRKLILVTGRELPELLELIPDPTVFDRIVAENGALVYDPEKKTEHPVAPGPPAEFVAELQKRGVDRISVGRVIVATWEPYQDTVLGVIRDLGLELQVIFNKGAVMVLPSGVNKASGLAEALVALGLSRHNVVAIGDAENDHALLQSAECGVAVANALDSLKTTADIVTDSDHGRGVSELVDCIVEDDLAKTATRLKRHYIRLGKAGEREIGIDPYSANIMVCGTSGSGKSTLTTGLLERMCKDGYQFAIIDPEGDYTTLDFAVSLGGTQRPPLVEEIIDVLAANKDSVVANLLGVAVDHRPELCVQILPALAELRARTGRPHWLVIDEAHHLLPAPSHLASEIPVRPHGTLYITVHPKSVMPKIISTIDTVIAVGEHPEVTIREFCEAANMEVPDMEPIDKLAQGTVVYWKIGDPPVVVVTEKPEGERTRHSRKYAEGNLGTDRAFVFRGPEGKLGLRAPNLHLFLHIGDGVDDDTWQFHLQNNDYSTWLRTQVKDPELADEVEEIERADLDPSESRARIRASVEKRYTLPSDRASGLVE
jgi:hydroxymethylpyrimidine pyrophosphatase-like HAD family hydrolase